VLFGELGARGNHDLPMIMGLRKRILARGFFDFIDLETMTLAVDAPGEDQNRNGGRYSYV
jgi:hypothetical protein